MNFSSSHKWYVLIGSKILLANITRLRRMLARQDCHFVKTASGNYEHVKEQARLSAECGCLWPSSARLGCCKIKMFVSYNHLKHPCLWNGQCQNLSQQINVRYPTETASTRKAAGKANAMANSPPLLNVIVGWKMEMPTHKNHHPLPSLWSADAAAVATCMTACREWVRCGDDGDQGPDFYSHWMLSLSKVQAEQIGKSRKKSPLQWTESIF